MVMLVLITMMIDEGNAGNYNHDDDDIDGDDDDDIDDDDIDDHDNDDGDAGYNDDDDSEGTVALLDYITINI